MLLSVKSFTESQSETRKNSYTEIVKVSSFNVILPRELHHRLFRHQVCVCSQPPVSSTKSFLRRLKWNPGNKTVQQNTSGEFRTISSLCKDVRDLTGAVVRHIEEIPSVHVLIKEHFLCLAVDIKSCRFPHAHIYIRDARMRHWSCEIRG